jgi:hypothetical protein
MGEIHYRLNGHHMSLSLERIKTQMGGRSKP